MGKYKEPNTPIDILKAREDITWYKGYYVSKDGEIWNSHGHRMTPYKNSHGVWVVMLREGKKRVCPTVNRFLFEAWNPKQRGNLKNTRISSLLCHDYEINNGFSDKPVFSLDDIIVTKTVPGGNPRTKEYKKTYIRRKQEIIDKRSELMKFPKLHKKEIAILDWVLSKED